MRTVRGPEPTMGCGHTRTDLQVYGMRDMTSGEAISDALGRLEGVQTVQFDVPTRRVAVTHDPVPEIAARICETLRNIGFRAFARA